MSTKRIHSSSSSYCLSTKQISSTIQIRSSCSEELARIVVYSISNSIKSPDASSSNTQSANRQHASSSSSNTEAANRQTSTSAMLAMVTAASTTKPSPLPVLAILNAKRPPPPNISLPAAASAILNGDRPRGSKKVKKKV